MFVIIIRHFVNLLRYRHDDLQKNEKMAAADSDEIRTRHSNAMSVLENQLRVRILRWIFFYVPKSIDTNIFSFLIIEITFS